MEELRLYLNSLSLEEQREFATKCGTSIGYLRKALSRNPKSQLSLQVWSRRGSVFWRLKRHLDYMG